MKERGKGDKDVQRFGTEEYRQKRTEFKVRERGVG